MQNNIPSKQTQDTTQRKTQKIKKYRLILLIKNKKQQFNFEKEKYSANNVMNIFVRLRFELTKFIDTFFITTKLLSN